MIGQLANDFPSSGWAQIPRGLFNFGRGGLAEYGSACGVPAAAVAVMGRIGMSDHWCAKLLHYYEQTTFPQNDAYSDYRNNGWVPAAGWKPAPGKVQIPLNNAPKSIAASTLCHSSITNWRAVSADWIDQWAAVGVDAKKDRCGKLVYGITYSMCELINLWASLGCPADPPVDLEPHAAASVDACMDGCHSSTSDPGAMANGEQDCLPCHTQRPGDNHGM